MSKMIDMPFLLEIDARMPEKGIAAKFNTYAALPPEKRMAQAEQDLRQLPRTGWIRIGVPQETWQTVWDHQESMVFLLRQVFGKKAGKFIPMATCHDMLECTATDLTPHDPITMEEKFRLEDMAARIVLAARPDLYKLWREYEDATTLRGKTVVEADKVEMVARTLYIRERHPDLPSSTMKDFWDYSRPRIQTPRMKSTFHTLENDWFRRTPSSPLYTKMREHYDLQL